MIFVCVVTDGTGAEWEVEADDPENAVAQAIEEDLLDIDGSGEEGTYKVQVTGPDGQSRCYQGRACLKWSIEDVVEVGDEQL